MARESQNTGGGKPDPAIVNEMVERIVKAVRPKRILLFGSAARGGMHGRRDLDLLVVMPDGTRWRKIARSLYRALSGLGVSKDLVVVTESDVRPHADNPSLVLFPALREGNELYHA